LSVPEQFHHGDEGRNVAVAGWAGDGELVPARVVAYLAEHGAHGGLGEDCGAVKAKLSLSECIFACDACGYTEDRDVNAARNLPGLAVSGMERENACGGMVRTRFARHVPVKQEPGTAHAGKTGTAAGQPAAAGQEFTHAH
jgi:hypothetical protein